MYILENEILFFCAKISFLNHGWIYFAQVLGLSATINIFIILVDKSVNVLFILVNIQLWNVSSFSWVGSVIHIPAYFWQQVSYILNNHNWKIGIFYVIFWMFTAAEASSYRDICFLKRKWKTWLSITQTKKPLTKTNYESQEKLSIYLKKCRFRFESLDVPFTEQAGVSIYDICFKYFSVQNQWLSCAPNNHRWKSAPCSYQQPHLIS